MADIYNFPLRLPPDLATWLDQKWLEERRANPQASKNAIIVRALEKFKAEDRHQEE